MTIYDWHYEEDLRGESWRFFKEKGFDVVACPALFCYPHMGLPARRNFENIRMLSHIARQNDLAGLNTTIWVPSRYLSDIIWQGIAYAAELSWGSSHFNEESFCLHFMWNFYGSKEGRAFYKAWKDLTSIAWHRNEFNLPSRDKVTMNRSKTE